MTSQKYFRSFMTLLKGLRNICSILGSAMSQSLLIFLVNTNESFLVKVIFTFIVITFYKKYKNLSRNFRQQAEKFYYQPSVLKTYERVL